jgi:2-dehydro-3-deoxy-D-arabinonate dehydratase
MRLYRTSESIFVERDDRFFKVQSEWDELICDPRLMERLEVLITGDESPVPPASTLIAPIENQEVWAAGVTYFKSREARIEESKDAGGGTFYDRIYDAARPEIFFKATGRRVVGPGGAVRIRSDATWSVPEPELTLVINSQGKMIGFTIGNDMSARNIEGENPLYLPQAKIYDGSCALGPCILIASEPPPSSTRISIQISRGSVLVFSGATTLAELKRTPKELIEFLFRDNSFPHGVFLMTGTGIVPNNKFTLASRDNIKITIDGIGALENYVQ